MTSKLKPITITIKLDEKDWKSIEPKWMPEEDRKELRFQNNWTTLFNEKIQEIKELPCPFKFKKQKFFKREGYPYFTCFGNCIYNKCGQQIEGVCQEKHGDNEMEIVFTCKDTIGINHNGACLRLKGAEREAVKNEALVMGPMQCKTLRAKTRMNESGGDCIFLNKTPVYRVALQEKRDQILDLKSFPGKPIESILAMADAFKEIRRVNLVPFFVYYWSDNQLELWKEAHNRKQFISIDATGSLVKRPEVYDKNKSSTPMLYVIVTQFGKKIFPISQNLNTAHDTDAIRAWLTEWLSTGAPIPRVCVVDCSMALLNAASIAFNKMNFSEYLEKCFNIVMGSTHEDLPKCYIKRDRGHLVKAIARLKIFQNRNWTKKDLYLRAIGFLLTVSVLQIFEDVITSIFVLCESQCLCEDTDPEKDCAAKRLSYLEDCIGTFEYKTFFNLKDKEHHGFEEEEQQHHLSMESLEEENKSHSSNLKNYIDKIYEDSKKIAATEPCGKSNCGNGYYLPELSKYLKVLFIQFLAWTNILNPYFDVIVELITSARSECFFKILKHNFNNLKAVSANRFLLKNFPINDGLTKLGRNTMKMIKPLLNRKSDEKLNVINETSISETSISESTYVMYKNYKVTEKTISDSDLQLSVVNNTTWTVGTRTNVKNGLVLGKVLVSINNEMKKLAFNNTCPFDSIFEIFVNIYLDCKEFQNHINQFNGKSPNQFVNLIFQYIRNLYSLDFFENERPKILYRLYGPGEEDTIRCEDTIGGAFKKLMQSFPSFCVKYECKCGFKLLSPDYLTSLSYDHFYDNKLENLNHSLSEVFEDKYFLCSKCKQNYCLRSYELYHYLCVDVEMLFEKKRIKFIQERKKSAVFKKADLNIIPTILNVREKLYDLKGIICFSGEGKDLKTLCHYASYSKSSKDQNWKFYDGLRDSITTVQNLPDKKQIALILYSLI